MLNLNVPDDVVSWLRAVFRACNERITAKLSLNPNIPEESLDLTWIEHLSRYATPVTLSSAWTVKVEAHYLGGMRHFGRWEIADIGVMLFIRAQGSVARSKVALLQSKRLYPTNMRVQEETPVDYEIGLARLADPETLAQSLSDQTEFSFTPDCQYAPIIPRSEQVTQIEEFEKQNKLAVYYQLYNPWTVPFQQRIPLTAYTDPSGPMTHGVRILSAKAIHGLLKGDKANRPRMSDLGSTTALNALGWPLESFIADEFLACREGTRFDSPNEGRLQNLFYRRSGAIAAAIAITIEAPSAAAG